MTDSSPNIQLCQAIIIILQYNLRENGAPAMEVAPLMLESAIFDRWPWMRKAAHGLQRLTLVWAGLGMGLSRLRQSSLEVTYGVLSGRAIWLKSSLRAMSILSAAAGGIPLTRWQPWSSLGCKGGNSSARGCATRWRAKK